MQIYFHSRLCSYLSRVPILVEGTVTAVNLHVDFRSEDAPDEVLTSMDDLDVSVRWLQFHLFLKFVPLLLQYSD